METLAYAVAHDLKSPLRSMLSFSQLLTRRLPEDPDIREYAGHIISGAAEMQAVIDSVQKLANVARPKRTTTRTAIGLDVILQLALLGMQTKLRDCGGEVHFDKLPQVSVDESQFKDLFENLIGNSLLYRGPEPPRINIRAEDTGDEYTISVQDNSRNREAISGEDFPGVLAVTQ